MDGDRDDSSFRSAASKTFRRQPSRKALDAIARPGAKPLMNFRRPDPDALLERVRREEAVGRKGSLKIFFGYAAGVGKTYAMLKAARRAADSGRDLVAGYVEPHGRPETESLLGGLEVLPIRHVEYRGVALREFDVDAALARKPDLILVDELAHTNAEGCRHAKRWQDVEELLEAGINVWTTLNVQHIDSLNDVIGRVTGVTVQETVPDRVFDLADDLELVDVSPQELLDRLRAGKVYVPDQAERALRGFFQKSNLAALREFSFRQAARRVHSDVESARRQQSGTEPWATSDRLLVCVGPSPTTARVIRTAKRMASALDAPWMAVAVESIGMATDPSVKEQIAKHFRLAERLGGETVSLAGENVAATLLEYASARNVSKILIGKTHRPRRGRPFFRTIVDEVLDRSGDVDVYVIRGEEERTGSSSGDRRSSRGDRRAYALTTAIVAASTLLSALFMRLRLGEANLVMVFLAAVAFVAYRFGRGPAVWASIASVLAFDFFFVPPYLTFAVSDWKYLITFAVMLSIGLAIGTLTARLKAQVEIGRIREARTSALYRLGKQLSSLSGGIFLTSAAGRLIGELTGGEVAVYLSRADDMPELVFGERTSIAAHPVAVSAARWAIDHDQIAGAGTDTLPNAPALFLPLTASQQTVGAVAVKAAPIESLLEPDQRRLLEACCGQLALALERDRMSIAASEALVQAKTEQVRNSLLSSVSHDLRTPLAVIAGAGSSLLRSDSIDDETRRRLLETIAEETDRLHRLLENILQMSKLETGESGTNKQWHVLQEIIGSALERVRRELQGREIRVRSPDDLPLLFVDGLLMEQLFVNLLENAARYSPPGTAIEIRAIAEGERLSIVTADNGPGLTPGTEERVFEKFYRGSSSPDSGRGSGLGLAICRAVAQVHGGTISASNRPEGGAEFVLRLPLSDHPPQVAID